MPDRDRLYSLVEGECIEGRFEGGIETAIWRAINAFNKREIFRGAPPATCTEIMRALAYALWYVTIYLGDPNGGAGVCGVVNNSECDEVSIEAFIEQLKRTGNE